MGTTSRGWLFETPADQGTSSGEDHRSDRDQALGALIRDADTDLGEPLQGDEAHWAAQQAAEDPEAPAAEEEAPAQEAPAAEEAPQGYEEALAAVKADFEERLALETQRREDAQRAFHERSEALAEAQRQLQAGPAPGQPVFGAFNPQSVEELIAKADESVDGAFEAAQWVLALPEGAIDLDLARSIVTHWAQNDQVRYRAWEMEQTRLMQAETLEPVLNQFAFREAKLTAAEASLKAKEQLPDFATHAPAIQAMLEANPGLMSETAWEDPDEMLEIWTRCYDAIIGAQWRKTEPERRAAAAQAAAEATEEAEAAKVGAAVEGSGQADPSGGVRARPDDNRPARQRALGAFIREAGPND